MAKTEKYVLGVKAIKYADPAADGGMPTTLPGSASPMNETVTFEEEEGETTKHYCQGDRYPFLTVHASAGTTLKFAVVMTNENLKQWAGGDVVAGQWKAPAGNFQKTQSLELITEFGVPIQIPKATCFGVSKFASKVSDLSKIEVTAIVEMPDKVGESPMTIGTKDTSTPGI